MGFYGQKYFGVFCFFSVEQEAKAKWGVKAKQGKIKFNGKAIETVNK